MSSTTVTEFYGLTQYIGTDKPSFTDNNEAFRNIDGDLHTAVVGVSDQAEAISAIRATVASLGSSVVTLQNDLDTEKGKIVNLQNKETLQDAEIANVKANARNMITAYNEETAESTHAYSAGDYFTYNNVLYKATDTIAIGDTIVPDTNCTTDNVTTELIAMTSELSDKADTTDLLYLSQSGSGATISAQLQSLKTFFDTLSINQKLTSLLVINGDVYRFTGNYAFANNILNGAAIYTCVADMNSGYCRSFGVGDDAGVSYQNADSAEYTATLYYLPA